MQLLKFLYFGILGAASPWVAPGHGKDNECCYAKCYERLTYADSHDMGQATEICTSYQRTTVTPCPIIKTVHTTAIVTTTLGQPHKHAADDPVDLHAAPKCTQSVSAHRQPRYANGYCWEGDFAAACSCLGVHSTTITAAQRTVTSTKCGGTKTITRTPKSVEKTSSTRIKCTSTKSTCLTTETTVTTTTTPTARVTISSTVTKTTTTYGATVTVPASSATNTVLMSTTITITAGTTSVILPISTFTSVCSAGAETMTTTVTTLTEAGNQARGLRSVSDPCISITKTSTVTGKPSTSTTTSIATTTVTTALTSTVATGVSTSATQVSTTITITVPTTITVNPDPTTVCVSTSTAITGTETITSTITTTSTNAVITAPTPCGNQGVQWAYYPNQNQNTDNTYSTFNDASIETFKMSAPSGQGTTTSVGGIDYSGGQAVNIYGSSQSFSTSYFALNHRGYIFAEISGTYTIELVDVDDIALIWLGPLAYSGWTRENAFELAVYSSDAQTNGSASTNVQLTGGTYTAFRVLFGQAQGPASFYIQVTAPDGSVFLSSSSQGSPYIVQYSCDTTAAPPYPPFGSEQ